MENTNSGSRIRCFYSKCDLLFRDISYARHCISVVGELEIWKLGRQTGSRWSDRALYGITRGNLGYVGEGFITKLDNFQYLLVVQWSPSG